MQNLWIVCLLLGTLAWGQTKPTPPPAQGRPPATDEDDDDDDRPQAAAKPSNLALDTPVLTIKGLCAKPSSKASAAPAGPCQTVITRAQFERLADAIQPSMSEKSKRQLASSYPRLLVLAHAAEAHGLNKGVLFEERLRFARLQILSQEILHEFQKESSRISESAIADYYKNNPATFEQATLERIVVPVRRQITPLKDASADDAAKAQKEAEEAMRKEAEDLRARAAAGEDFAILQKEAYEAAGLKSSIGSASLGKMRRNQIPSGHASVFDLKPGAVSKVISDASGHYIYKVDAKEVEPLATARDEIRGKLQDQRMREMLGSLERSYTTDVNGAYFGPRRSNEESDEGTR